MDFPFSPVPALFSREEKKSRTRVLTVFFLPKTGLSGRGLGTLSCIRKNFFFRYDSGAKKERAALRRPFLPAGTSGPFRLGSFADSVRNQLLQNPGFRRNASFVCTLGFSVPPDDVPGRIPIFPGSGSVSFPFFSRFLTAAAPAEFSPQRHGLQRPSSPGQPETVSCGHPGRSGKKVL